MDTGQLLESLSTPGLRNPYNKMARLDQALPSTDSLGLLGTLQPSALEKHVYAPGSWGRTFTQRNCIWTIVSNW